MNIAYQTELRPALPNVYGASDYRDFRDQLAHIDRLLRASGEEDLLVQKGLERWEKEAHEAGKTARSCQRH